MAWRVGKLTEEGKWMFSWQFDDLVDMDDVRCVTDTQTGEITLCIKVSKDVFDKMTLCDLVRDLREFHTQKGIWFMYNDGYDNYCYREGDIIK